MVVKNDGASGSQYGSVKGATPYRPSVGVITAPNAVWYELAIDSAATPDGIIDAGDIFANRVQVHSVLFARRADSATVATRAAFADAFMQGAGVTETARRSKAADEIAALAAALEAALG